MFLHCYVFCWNKNKHNADETARVPRTMLVILAGAFIFRPFLRGKRWIRSTQEQVNMSLHTTPNKQISVYLGVRGLRKRRPHKTAKNDPPPTLVRVDTP